MMNRIKMVIIHNVIFSFYFLQNANLQPAPEKQVLPSLKPKEISLDSVVNNQSDDSSENLISKKSTYKGRHRF